MGRLLDHPSDVNRKRVNRGLIDSVVQRNVDVDATAEQIAERAADDRAPMAAVHCTLNGPFEIDRYVRLTGGDRERA